MTTAMITAMTTVRLRRRPLVALALGALSSTASAACGDVRTTAGATTPVPALGSPAATATRGLKIVASTSWAAAFARAAGATDVTTIAPANVQHPPDYDPKPSDLAALAGADIVLLAGFEGFAQRLREAIGGASRVVPVKLENTPATITEEVTRLGDLFGTAGAAKAYLTRFDAEYARLSNDVKATLGANRPTVVAHAFVVPWATFAGLEVVGTYGPMPLQPAQPAQLAELVAKGAGAVFENGHVPIGQAVVEASGAKEVRVINFPGPAQALLDVFAENARLITTLLGARGT